MTYSAKDFTNLIGMEGFSETLLRNHFALYEGYVSNTNKLFELLDGKAKDARDPEYAELKRVLAERFPRDRVKYTEAKTDFIVRMTREAKEHYGAADAPAAGRRDGR